MPEFILDRGTAESARTFTSLDDFTKGYIEALFFTETSEELEDASFADLAPSALAEIMADCAAFQSKAADLLNLAYERDYDATQAGRDFWFTRNGHGVGFWDRKPLEEDGLGDRLSKLCGWRTEWQEVNPCFGDDGLVYHN